MKLNVKINYLSLIITIFLILLSYINNIMAKNIIYDQYKGQKKSLNIYNWGEYLSDGSNGNLDVNKEFEKLTGVKINYSTFASNEELYAKLRNKSAKYDIIIPSDYMISKMIEEDMIIPLDFDKIPNYNNIDDKFKNLNYDIDNKYSVPYMWGTVGIIYNKSLIDKQVKGWHDLWDEIYSGKILMFSNPRDCFGVALKKLGYSVNTTNKKEILEASNEIYKQKKLVQAYVMDEIFNKMENKEAVIAPYYSGDAITMMKENSDLMFIHPKEGTNIFIDAICIPKDGQNQEQAYLYINFLLEPKVALANVKYIGYSTPNKKAYDLLDDDIKNNLIAYPNKEVMGKAESFMHLPIEINKLIDQQWTKIMSVNNINNKWFIPVFLIFGVIVSIFINIYRYLKKKQKANIKF